MAVVNAALPGTETLSPYVGYDGMAAGVDGTTHRPYTLAEQDVEANMRLDAINTKLTERATLSDVFVTNMGYVVHNHGDGKVTLPDAMCVKVTAPSGSRTYTIPIVDPLRGAPRAGNDLQAGHEIGQRMRFIKIHYNEYSQAVAIEKWGVTHNDLELHFGLFSRAQPALSKYFLELDGRQFRQASLETYSDELIKDRGLIQNWNPNVFVANTDPFNQPAYDPDPAVYAANISTAMEAAATGALGSTNGEFANISAEFIEAALEHAEVTLRLEPLNVSGQDTYIMVIPSNQYAKMTSLAGEFGNMWVDYSSLTADEQNFPGVMGRYKKILFVSDSRYPVVGVDYVTDVLTPTYVEPGNEDQRNRGVYVATTNQFWSVGGFYGAGSFYDWTVRDLHFEENMEEYGKKVGVGAFTERGIQLGLIRTDTESSGVPTYVENTGSMALFFTNTSTLTVRPQEV